MLAVLFWLGLFGYALTYSGIAGLGVGNAPGVIEVLNPKFRGVLRGPGQLDTGGGGKGKAPTSGILPNTGAAERCEVFHRDVMQRFANQGLSHLGINSCRRINHSTSPSDPWSEHAWGEASDYGGSESVLKRAAAWACKNAKHYGITNIQSYAKLAPCVNVQSGYPKTIHVGFSAPRMETPPCAQGGKA